MFDKTTLSKHKHIYIPRVVFGVLHIEKFPVVYINSQFVYYAPGNHEQLQYLPMINVEDSMEDCLRKNAEAGLTPTDGTYRRGFWKVTNNKSDNIREILKDLEQQAVKNRYSVDIDAAQKKVRDAEDRLEKAKLTLQMLKARSADGAM